MGRKANVVVTYGRHRNRVTKTDFWKSDDEKCVFSSSNSSTDFEGSIVDSMSFSSGRNMLRGCKAMKLKDANKENETSKKSGSTRHGKQYTCFSESDKDSCSSLGGDSAVSQRKSTRRVLRDRNALTESNPSITDNITYRNRKSRRQNKKIANCRVDQKPVDTDYPSFNFSQFDDYSLLMSSQSVDGITQNISCSIETSTPYRKKTPDIRVPDQIKAVNLSLIDTIAENSPVASECEMSFMQVGAKHELSIVIDSPILIEDSPMFCRTGSSRFGIRSRLCILNEGNRLSYNNKCDGQSSQLSRDQSRSLFDSPMDVGTQPMSMPLDSKLLLTSSSCIVRVQKMRDSFIEANLNSGHSSPVLNHSENFRYFTRSTSKKCFSNPLCFRDVLFDNGCVTANLLDDETEDDDDNVVHDNDEDDNDNNDNDDDSDYVNGEDRDDYLSDISEIAELISDSDDDVHVETDVSEARDMTVSLSDDAVLTKAVMDMDVSCARSPMYYSAGSDVSLYQTAEGSVLSKEGSNIKQSLRPRNKQLSNVLAIADLSRSFAEMLSPQTKDKPTESPRSKLFQICNQKSPVSFHSILPKHMMKDIKKIGEGVYGEVFRTYREGKSVAIKVIPIEGDFKVNDEVQKTFGDILSEVVISKELSDLRAPGSNMSPSFCQVNCVACVKGCYPDKFLSEWDVYNVAGRSENDRPDIFDENQLYLVFEFADGGLDLESFKFADAWQAWSVLQQVTLGLAVAEESLEFEHRDLHIGNVLVKKVEGLGNLQFSLLDTVIELEPNGVIVSIIDFTLSRLRKDGCTVFCDLANDDALFEGKGDYQFDIYRNMKKENKNDWDTYCPYTNLLWLHYLADKLLKQKQFKKSGRTDRVPLRNIRQFQSEVLKYVSAKHLVLESEHFNT